MHEAGDEAVAALWASETVIYGRFGYGMATLTADLIVSTPEARFRIPREPADVQLTVAPEAIDAHARRSTTPHAPSARA